MQRRRASVLLALAVTAASLACTGLLLFGGPVLPAAASVIQQVGATPMAVQGTVRTGPLGVREEPAVTSRVIGTLPVGSKMNILGRREGWYEIEYAPGPEGKGWVSARFVQTGSGNTSPGTATGTDVAAGTVSGVGQAPAPAVIAYQPPMLRWKWVGDPAALADKDWFFDVQVFRKFDAYPYWTQAVEPPGKAQGAVQQGDTYSVDIQATDFRCESSFAVQVALRENGRFADWISPCSNLLLFTRVCPQNTPTPGPHPTRSHVNDQVEDKPLRPGGWTGDARPANPQPLPPPPRPSGTGSGGGGQGNQPPQPPGPGSGGGGQGNQPPQPPGPGSGGGGQTNPEPEATPPAPPESTAVPTP